MYRLRPDLNRPLRLLLLQCPSIAAGLLDAVVVKESGTLSWTLDHTLLEPDHFASSRLYTVAVLRPERRR